MAPQGAPQTSTTTSSSPWSSDTAVLSYVAAATVIIHLVIGGRYGFHRDELATLDDARHLAILQMWNEVEQGG